MSEQVGEDENRRLRSLLPARGPRSPPAAAPRPRPRPGASRQAVVKAACDACRKCKSKCSGDRPICRRCVQRKIPCHYAVQQGETSSQALKRTYNNLRDRAAAHEDVIEMLRNLPLEEAHEVLRRLRNGADVVTILNHVRAGDLLLQLAVLPETRFRYEFPYRSELPGDLVPNNPYLDSLLYEAASLYSPSQSTQPSENAASTFAANLGSVEYQSLYLKPFHAAHVVDPRLSDVRPSVWTSVCDDNTLMRELLGVFFRCEYHFTAAFQKDYFLDDMAAGRKDFCSSLLVNVVLGYSCVCYPRFLDRAEYWNPRTLQYRFLAEAKRLWELEATEARITTVQAGMLFNVFYNLCGLDEIGQAYRIQAIALANELRLFNGKMDGLDERTRNGRAFTAWSLFSWEALVGFSFMHAPLLTQPHDVHLPDPSEDDQFYGEVWIAYPFTHRPVPSYFGYVFRAKCQFRVIMSEFCQAAYSKGSAVSLSKADDILRQLRRWYDGLPKPLTAKTIVLPAHLQLHIYYYHLILTICEPLLDIESGQEPSLHQITAEADKHLQTLVRLYYLRHGFEAMDLFIVIPLMLAGFKCIDALDDKTPPAKVENLRSTLMLVAKGLYSQRRNHYLAEALFRVVRGRMRPQEVALLRDTIRIDEDETGEKQALIQTVRSHWPVSVVRKKEDLDSHILKNLVDNYAHLNVEDGPVVAHSDQ